MGTTGSIFDSVMNWSTRTKTNHEFESRAELEQDLIDRALDAEFRQELLTNPRATLNETYSLALGVDADINICVHQEDPNNIHIVLPMNDSDMLSDEDLDAVAGGLQG